jgi:hypothetical protein
VCLTPLILPLSLVQPVGVMDRREQCFTLRPRWDLVACACVAVLCLVLVIGGFVSGYHDGGKIGHWGTTSPNQGHHGS